MASKTYWEAVKGRRSIYGLGKDVEISDDKIVELVNETVLNTPSAFNSQTARLVVLFKDDHDQFWDFVLDTLRPLVPADAFAQTEGRIAGFKGAYVTVLFFEDTAMVKSLQEQFAVFADKFPSWSRDTTAMHQHVLWTAVEAEGLGANLQHYNPVVDDKVKQHWKIPAEWELTAQLVIGSRVSEPGPKESKPLEGRVIVHGK
ncbi:Nitroreductase-like protein [Cladochytrium replicatum]|nr:Nitroreductase-like protein [Cladochytrium replicatum]